MRIIIEMEEGAASPELKITSQGTTQTQHQNARDFANDPLVKTTDAGGPKYASADQPTQSSASQNEGQTNGSSGASAGAAPGDELN